MRTSRLALLGWLIWSVTGSAACAQSDSVPQLLAALRAVEREGKGHRPATRAWTYLTSEVGADQLPTVLAAIDDAQPLAANWLRAAVDAIAEREVQQSGKLPTEALEKFLHEKHHDPRARRLAYEWIARVDPTAPGRLIPGMLDDPSLEMRRDAVAEVIAAAEDALAEENSDAALSNYEKALDAARDLDQIKLVAEALGKLGHPVDLSHHFGFVMDWKLLGPFDNVDGVGFDTPYPPEEAVDLSSSHAGTTGAIRWIAHTTDDQYGNVDLNKAVGKHMGVVGYAAKEFLSDRSQPAEVRVGSQNAVKIWLNGKLLASAEAYHANGVMDQYVGRGELAPGRNLILVKVCQNEQTEAWAQDWHFQLRVCDPLGKAIHATDRPASVVDSESNAKAATE